MSAATQRDFYSERVVQGRRAYRCAFCRQEIAKGAAHVVVSSCSLGEFQGHRAHVACQEAASGRVVEAREPGRDRALAGEVNPSAGSASAAAGVSSAQSSITPATDLAPAKTLADILEWPHSARNGGNFS